MNIYQRFLCSSSQLKIYFSFYIILLLNYLLCTIFISDLVCIEVSFQTFKNSVVIPTSCNNSICTMFVDCEFACFIKSWIQFNIEFALQNEFRKLNHFGKVINLIFINTSSLHRAERCMPPVNFANWTRRQFATIGPNCC